MTPSQLQLATADSSRVAILIIFGELRSMQGLIVLLVVAGGLGGWKGGLGLVCLLFDVEIVAEYAEVPVHLVHLDRVDVLRLYPYGPPLWLKTCLLLCLH